MRGLVTESTLVLPLAILLLDQLVHLVVGLERLEGSIGDLEHVLLAEVGADADGCRINIVNRDWNGVLLLDRVQGVQRYLKCVGIMGLILLEKIWWVENSGSRVAFYALLGIPNVLQKMTNVHLSMQLVFAFLEHAGDCSQVLSPTAERCDLQPEYLPTTDVDLNKVGFGFALINRLVVNVGAARSL